MNKYVGFRLDLLIKSQTFEGLDPPKSLPGSIHRHLLGDAGGSWNSSFQRNQSSIFMSLWENNFHYKLRILCYMHEFIL